MIYFTQGFGDALEQYTNNKPEKIEDEYQTRFTPCWCESRPKNPNCNDVGEPASSIDNPIYGITIIFIFISLAVFKKIKL